MALWHGPFTSYSLIIAHKRWWAHPYIYYFVRQGPKTAIDAITSVQPKITSYQVLVTVSFFFFFLQYDVVGNCTGIKLQTPFVSGKFSNMAAELFSQTLIIEE